MYESNEAQEQILENQQRLEQIRDQQAQDVIEQTDKLMEQASAVLAREAGMSVEAYMEKSRLELAERDPEYARYLAEEQIAQKNAAGEGLTETGTASQEEKEDAETETGRGEPAEDEEKLNENQSKPSFGSSGKVCAKLSTGTQNYCYFAGFDR